jgi:hypothetical protein
MAVAFAVAVFVLLVGCVGFALGDIAKGLAIDVVRGRKR